MRFWVGSHVNGCVKRQLATWTSWTSYVVHTQVLKRGELLKGRKVRFPLSAWLVSSIKASKPVRKETQVSQVFWLR